MLLRVSQYLLRKYIHPIICDQTIFVNVLEQSISIAKKCRMEKKVKFCCFLDFEQSSKRGIEEKKGRTADNRGRNEIRVAHTMQNSNWSKSKCPSIRSDT